MPSSDYPAKVEELILLFKTLPGIGRRGAERMALAVLKWPAAKQTALGRLIAELPDEVERCPECGALCGKGDGCAICAGAGRDTSLLCVVEEPQQIFAIEKSGCFRGLYHVLGGKLSPLAMENGEGLTTGKLAERIAQGGIKEVILALSADVEGRATAIYVAEKLRDCGVKISQPALGLPAGATLAYADGATISAALSARLQLN